MFINKVILSLMLITSLQSCQSDKRESYYQNGKIAYEVPLKNGKKNGEMISFHKNGIIKGKANYENDKLSGEAKVYDSLGNIFSTFQYQNNKKNGKFKIYYPNGTVNVEGEYKKDKPHGKGFEYYTNGDLMKKYVYSMGQLIYMKAYNREGVQYDSMLDINITKIDGQDSVYIELGYSEYDSAGIIVVFGNLSPQKRLIDTLAIHGAKDMDLIYGYTKNQKLLSGVLYEMKLPEKTLEAAYFFEYDL